MILITGATGNVGRELVLLLAEGGHDVRAVTRNASAARLPDGVEIVQADPSQAASLSTALEGVDALFLNPITTSAPYQPAGEPARTLLELAAGSGVRRVVLLSGAAAANANGGGDPLAVYFRSYEKLVTESRLPWTFLQPGEFAANALAWVPQIRGGDTVRDAYGEASTAPIHERDIAAVAMRALLGDERVEARIVIDGAEALTKRQKVDLIGQALGRKLLFEEVPPVIARQAMIRHGFSEAVADTVLAYQAASIEHPGPASDGIERLLGRPPLSFAQWATDRSAIFGG
jgi:uncharacterized protein YbjT (DUF2867 family)